MEEQEQAHIRSSVEMLTDGLMWNAWSNWARFGVQLVTLVGIGFWWGGGC